MIINYDSKELKPYKEYTVHKIWDINSAGKKVNISYQISDNEQNPINYFKTLSEAKNYINTVLK